ncbi:hypothetical protein GCM10010344_19770 [Streptomyces bluensis]|nr:hypothetical protein GCM10010344_19770 [Streptomyces bluensis]
MRAEQDPGQDEEGNGGQSDAPAEACEDSGGEECAAHGDEGVCVSDGLVLQFDQSGWYGKCSKGSVKNASIVTLPKYSERAELSTGGVAHSPQTPGRTQTKASSA